MPHTAGTRFPVLADLSDQHTGAPRHLYGVLRPLRHAQWAACDFGGRLLRETKAVVAAQTLTACLWLSLPSLHTRRGPPNREADLGAVIYADVCQPPKSASYFNQLPADLFDLATGKGRSEEHTSE